METWSFERGTPPQLDAYDAVFVFGGSMHPDQDELFPWLSEEADWLRSLLERPQPTLGVCLGSELLAQAAGATVTRLAVPEIGWSEVELTEAGRGEERAAEPATELVPRADPLARLGPQAVAIGRRIALVADPASELRFRHLRVELDAPAGLA